jgi:hypothetical protein
MENFQRRRLQGGGPRLVVWAALTLDDAGADAVAG